MNNTFFSFKADFFKQQGKVKEKRTILKIKVLNFFQSYFGNHFRDNLQIGMLNLKFHCKICLDFHVKVIFEVSIFLSIIIINLKSIIHSKISMFRVTD